MATITENIQKSAESYKAPTPHKWRKVGDAIMGLGTVITAISAFTASPWITLISAALTWAGKTMTNFAS